MIRKFARFEVHPQHVEAALAAIRAFVDEVHRKEGGTAAYRAFQEKEQPTRFVHYMEFRTPAAEAYHRGTAWVKRFAATLYPLCREEPVFSDVDEVSA